jgi:hypothetical protein
MTVHYEELLGHTKEAIAVPPRVAIPIAKRISQFFSKYRPTWGGTKRFAVGEPGRFFKDVKKGRMWAPEGLLRQGMRESTKGWLGKGMFYGLPAYEAYNITQNPGAQKAERMGGLLASTPVWLAAWKPFGMVGSTALALGAERIGRGAGRLLGGPQPMPPQHAPERLLAPSRYQQRPF